MTYEERAEELVFQIRFPDSGHILAANDMRDLIAAQIREAVGIAEGAVGIKERAEWSTIMKLAVADAYEEAAKIADEISFTHCTDGEPCRGIGQAIRAQIKEAK